MCFRAPFMDGVAFHDPMHEATKKPLTTVAACHCSPYSPGRQSRPHLFHVVRKVCTKSGHVSTIPPVVKNNSHHGISTIKSDYPKIFAGLFVHCMYGRRQNAGTFSPHLIEDTENFDFAPWLPQVRAPYQHNTSQTLSDPTHRGTFLRNRPFV